MDTAANTLNIQQDLKVAELDKLFFDDYRRTSKCWSDYLTTPFTTIFAEGLNKTVNDRAKLYNVQCDGEKECQVHFIGDNVLSDDFNAPSEQDDEFWKVPIALYSRIHHVQVKMDGTMICDCYNFQGRGLFCVHQVKVATAFCEANGVEFKGFNHHDIDVRYLSGYMNLAYRASTRKQK